MALPKAGMAQVDTFKIGTDMRVAGNYSLGLPNANKDILLTTTSGSQLQISSAGVNAGSVNLISGGTYTIGDTSTVNPRALVIGNGAGATNLVSGVLNDFFYLTNNSSLTIQPFVGSGTKALGVTLANNGNFNVQSGSTLSISSAINGVAANQFSITKTGGGIFNLSGASSVNIGTITINAGLVSIINGALPTATSVVLNAGTLQASGVVTTNVANSFTLGGGTIDNNGNTVTLNGTLSGTDLISTGAGTLVISPAATTTYTGNTFIQNGTLKMAGVADALPTGTTVNFGQAASANLGVLDLSNLNLQVAGLNSIAGTNATAATNKVLTSGAALRTLTIGGSGTYTFGNGTAANSGVITNNSGTIAVTMAGTGTQILGGVNAYTGTTIFTNGELRFALPAASTQNLGTANFNGGTLGTKGSGAGASLVFSSMILNNSSTISLDSTVAYTLTFSAAGTFATGGQVLTITGWKGAYNGTSGTEAQIFVGNTSSALGATKLALIQFIDGGGNVYGATQLATGELVPSSTVMIATGSVSGSPFCPGTSGINVNFTYSPSVAFLSSTFTAQLSSATGSFTTPVTLQSVLSDGSGGQTISVTIPGTTVSGTKYRIRVVSSSPTVTGTDNGANLVVATGWIGTTTDWNTAANWCSGVVPTESTNVTIPSGSVYPIITGTSYVGNITISSGASVTVAGGALSIHGTITNNGTFDATAGTIQMTGSAAQTIAGSMFASSTINNLVDSNTNGTGLTITSGSPISITGQLSFGFASANLVTNNGLVLVSNASTTASVGQIAENGSGVAKATITGNVTVQRYYLNHRRWRLVTAPVQAATAPTISASWQEGGQSIAGSASDPNPGFGTDISGPTSGPFVPSSGYDQSATNSASIAHITGALAWFSLPTTFVPVTSYQGMMIFVRGGRDFPIFTGTSLTPATAATLRTTGALNTGRVTVPVSTGFTVIGNPYAATINFNNVYSHAATATAVPSNSFSLWDPNIGSIANVASGTGGWVSLSWNGSSYDASPDPHLFDGFDVNGDIQSGGAFVVSGSGSGSVEMDESDKVTGTDNHLYLFRPTTATASLRTTLFATDTSHVQTYLADGTLNEFNSSYSNNLDWSKDVQKQFNFAEKVSILKDGQNLSIQKSAPPAAGDTVYLSVTGLNRSTYQFVLATASFARPDINAFFIDSFTHITTPILLGDTSVTVNFTVTSVAASSAANRFSIVFKTAPAGSVAYTNIAAAVQQNKNIGVQWQVSDQLNTKEYVVERSTDKINYTVVDTTAATPTDTSSYVYNWTDANVAYGTNYYYRVYTVGNNLATQDTSAIASAVLLPTASINIAPNPVTNGVINLQMSSKMPAGQYGVKIIGPAGNVFLNETITHAASDEIIHINLNSITAKGVYELELLSQDKSTTKVSFEIL